MATEQAQTLGETQKILTLAWIVNALSGQLVSPESMEERLTKRIDDKLHSPMVQGYIGEWNRVWGPYVYLAPPPYNIYATNAMYVAQKDNQYVIGIAGTNFKSFHNWFIEDFFVSKQADWADYAANDIPGLPPKISMGTKIGIDNLLKQHEGSGTNIIGFLTDQLKETGSPVEIVVTGHSLGGALSPVLALALVEKKSEWDPHQRAKVKVYPFAGPTPGNAAFSTYYGLKLGNNTTRIWNKLDIVPHAWNLVMLNQLSTIYDPEITSNPLIELFVNLAKLVALRGYYTHIKPLAPALPDEILSLEKSAKQEVLDVQLSESLKSALATRQNLSSLDDDNSLEKFLTKALDQHISAYFDLLKFPSELKELLLTPLSDSTEAEATESLVTKLSEYLAKNDVAN